MDFREIVFDLKGCDLAEQAMESNASINVVVGEREINSVQLLFNH